MSKKATDIKEEYARTDNSCEREGIFQQFCYRLPNDLFYYAIYGSSDSKGNIRVADVKREKFQDTVKAECEAVDNVSPVKKEVGGGAVSTASDASAVQDSKRYGFRVRRLKTRRDDEFDTSICESSSDESCAEDVDEAKSSADETYDVAFDNWSVVRGSKKKPSDSNPKSTKTSQTQKASQSAKSAPLANSTFKSNRAYYKKTPGIIPNNKQLPKVKSTSSKTHRPVANKAPLITKGAVKRLCKSDHKLLIKDRKSPLSGIPKLNPNKIRFGYNATTATEPEMRHIRRRQLRQSVQSLSTPFGKSSSSSDEDTPLSMTTRSAKKLSRNVQSKDKPTTEPTLPCTDVHADKGELSVESTASITSGKGLKMVIRRQSTGSAISHKTVDLEPENGDSKDDSANGMGALNGLQAGDAQGLGENDNSAKNEQKKTENDVVAETVNAEEDRGNDCSPIQAGSDANSKDGQSTPNDAQDSPPVQASIATDTQHKIYADDDQSKKKKAKKKRRRERGRSASTAGTEEACNAEYTAMRLAMELPRHNWLVKHLIKEKKLNAEDDKPLNRQQGSDGANGQPVDSSRILARRTSTSDIPFITQDSTQLGLQSEKSAVSPDVSGSKAPNLRPEDAANSEDTKNNQANHLKGSSMVGIVKPFQHLKMSPVKAKDGNASPPPLCIVDDSVQQDQTTDGVEARASYAKRANLDIAATSSESLSNSGQIQVAVSLVSNNSVGSSEKTMQSTSDTDSTTPTSADKTFSLNMPTSSDTTLPPNTPTLIDTVVNSPPDKESNEQNTVESDTQNTSNLTDNSDDSKPASTAPANNDVSIDSLDEPESEIRIEKCVSLALDLTTKAKTSKSTDSDLPQDADQPLDLSMKSKSGEISPKILDLSIKKHTGSPKTKSVSSPAVAITVQTISAREKTVIAVEKHESPLQSSNPDATTATVTHIPIVNSPSVGVKINDSDKQRISNVVAEDASVTRLETPKTVSRPRIISPSGSPRILASQAYAEFDSAKSNPMKRCASLDATSTDFSLIPSQAKCGRFSLDDSRISDLRPPIHNPTRMVSAPPQPPGPRMEINKTTTKDMTQRMIKDASRITTNQRSTPIPEQPFVIPLEYQQRAQGTKLPPYSANSVSPQFARPQISVVRAASQPHHALRKTAPLRANSEPQPMRYHTVVHRRNSEPRTPTVNYRAQTPTNYPRISQPQAYQVVNSSMVPSTMMTVGVLRPPRYVLASDQTAKTRLPNIKSVQSNNIRAQMVAQAYQPEASSLEPYIKAQQRAVDEKIKELEAIKRQLADKSVGLSQSMMLGPSYPRPAKQIRHEQLSQPTMSVSHKLMTPSPIQPGQNITHLNQIRASHGMTPMHQRLPAPNTLHSPRVQQRHVVPRWRAVNCQERPSFGPRPSVSLALETGPQRAVIPVSHRAPVVTAGVPRQISAPRVYSQGIPITELKHTPTPRLVAASATAPVYRNGGLTIDASMRTKLNEPIVIEDDIAQVANGQMQQRAALQPNSTHSLKIRRAHSYHPPLSKNHHPVGPRQPAAVQGKNAPDPSTESCARCRGKAFFLCSGCRKIWYCNKSCQLQDWNTHSAVCSG